MIVGIDAFGRLVDVVVALHAVQFVDGAVGGVRSQRGTGNAGIAGLAEERILHGDDAAQCVGEGRGAVDLAAVLIMGGVGIEPAAARRDLEGIAGEDAVGLIVIDRELDGVVAAVGPGVRVSTLAPQRIGEGFA